jgi:hypothetical protein
MPGSLPAEAVDRPLSAIGRIKSAKALAAAERAQAEGGNGNGTAAAAYERGARGQLEDMDRLVNLDWTQVCAWAWCGCPCRL